ncbi:hypothetical protein [Streptomyces sp. NPDC056061]|uniref:hypothetical protein n=1 Tax=Streptomyces sp. NPDC056061 TaxID=3345700 RepID=UPI0035DAB7FC
MAAQDVCTDDVVRADDQLAHDELVNARAAVAEWVRGAVDATGSDEGDCVVGDVLYVHPGGYVMGVRILLEAGQDVLARVEAGHR